MTTVVTRQRSAVPWQVLFLLLAATWGCSFWWIKVGLRLLAPVQVAFGRVLLGAVALLVMTAVTRTPLPRRPRTWAHLAVVGLLFNAAPFTLFAYGETHVSSVLAGLVNAATPLATLVVVLAVLPEEHPTPRRLAGLLVGFAGVLVVLGVWRGLGRAQAGGILACVGAICCYGISLPYARRFLTPTGEAPLGLAAGQVLCGTALLAPFGLTASLPGGHHSAGDVAGMLALGLLGTGLAYAWSYRILAVAGATVVSTVTYVVPVFAVVAGAVFLGERLTWNEPVGGLVVLLGAALGQGLLPSRDSRRQRQGEARAAERAVREGDVAAVRAGD